jgi:ribosomal protein S18 acetylase RimI-like enzyme
MAPPTPYRYQYHLEQYGIWVFFDEAYFRDGSGAGYLDAYVEGWGIAEKDHAQFKANVRPWLSQPGWSLYVGHANGRPVAAATLYLHDGIGYLADAATHPSFRRRGLQSAPLRRRIRDAGAAELMSYSVAPLRFRQAIATWSAPA